MTAKNPVKSLNAASSAAWMERLRSKAGLYRSATDLSKATRTTLLDRRNGPDAKDRVDLRASLDQLANAVPARNASSLADRLEAISKQVASRWAKRGVGILHFNSAPVHRSYYLSTDCFYVEINIEGSTGRVAAAMINHELHQQTPNQQTSSPKNCPEMIDCLNKGQFSKFVDHLEGLMAIYDMPEASLQDKTQGWKALSSLENDILRIDQLRGFADDVSTKINHGALGFVQPRAGGLPMKITFFMSAKDKIDMSTKKFKIPNSDMINEHNIGLSATLGLERNDKPKALPIHSLIMADGKEVPIGQHNSVTLPARFVLELNDEMPLESSKCQDIINITGIDFLPSNQKATPMLQLVTKQNSNGVLDSSNNRGLFVTLPDQSHCYFLMDHESLQGHTVKRIPFSHPSNLIGIITILRQQAVFNAIIGSCIRTTGIQDLDKAILFEVSCMDLQNICVTFEASQGGGIASFELNFSELRNIQCSMHKMIVGNSPFNKEIIGSPETVAKTVFEKTLSLPLTMRSLIKHLGKRIKNETSMTSSDLDFSSMHYNNGNLDNGNVIPMDLDFNNQPTVKSEPMDFESGSAEVHTKNGKDHLNARRPQDAALILGVRESAKINNHSKNTTPTNNQISNNSNSHLKQPQVKMEASSAANTTKKQYSNDVEIKAFTKAKPMSRPSAPSPSSKTTSSSSSSKIGSDIKPSVSITPVTSADTTTTNSAASLTKNKAGIEIIPLDKSFNPTDSEKHRSPSSHQKDIKRSLSEDDKRRLEKKQKRKREHFDEKNSDSDKKLKHSSSSSSTSKKLNNVIDRLSTNDHHGSSSGGIEIVPTSGSGGTGSSSSSKLKVDSKSSSSSSSNLHSLKLTIKNSGGSSSGGGGGSGGGASGGGGSGSGSSSSKHRSSSDSYHKSSSKSSSSSSSSNKYSSSAKRSSPSLSQMMKHSKSPSSGSGSSSSGSSKHRPVSSSSSSDQKSKYERQRLEDVKKLLGGNKLDTTFQIPKRTKPADSISDPSKAAKSASTSPKYSISPKSGGTGSSSSGVGSSYSSSSASDFPPDLKSSSQKCGVTSASPTHNPPILSPSAVKSGSAGHLMMSLAGSGGMRNNVGSSPPNLAAFDKTGCDKTEETKMTISASIQHSKS